MNSLRGGTQWLTPALTQVILGASKDDNLTSTSDGWQPKSHTVLSTTDRNLKVGTWLLTGQIRPH